MQEPPWRYNNPSGILVDVEGFLFPWMKTNNKSVCIYVMLSLFGKLFDHVNLQETLEKTKLSWASKSCFLMTRTKQDPSVQPLQSNTKTWKMNCYEFIWICYCFSAWPTLTTLSSRNCRKKMACFHLFSFTFLSGPGLSRSTSCSLGQPVAETSLGWNLDQKVSSFGMKLT